METGTGLTGGPITSSGTISIANTGVAPGTYNNVTVNAQGQVTTGSNTAYLTSEADGSITNEGALSVDPGGANTSVIQSNTSGSGSVTLTGGNNISITESGNNITIAANTNGTVTSVGTGTGLTGGPINSIGTISIANTGVTPGSYNNVTVNAQGQVTSASNAQYVSSVGTGTGLTGGPITGSGTISLANTGVTPGTYSSVTVNAQGQVTGATNPAFPTGTGANGYVTYWTGASTQSYDSDGFFWDAANNNLGIGTASPGNIVHLYRNGSTPTLQLYSNRSASSASPAQLMEARILFGGVNNQGWSTANGAGIDFHTNYPAETSTGRLNFWAYPSNSSSPNLTVWNGNVGIGATSPAVPLHVSRSSAGNFVTIENTDGSSSGAYAQMRLLSGSRSGYIWVRNQSGGGEGDGAFNIYSEAGDLNLWANSTRHVTVKGAGNVGIGTTAPAWKLDVVGNARVGANASQNQIGALAVSAGQGAATRYRDIDIHGSWAAGEEHAITWSHASGAADIVGQITSRHTSPGSSLYFGKLYHSGNSTFEAMELRSTSGSSANLIMGGGGIAGNYGLIPSYRDWSTYGTGDGGAAIYNDANGYKKLMIVGNNSAGGVRQVGIWDDLTVYGLNGTGNRVVMADGNGKLFAQPSSWVTKDYKTILNSFITLSGSANVYTAVTSLTVEVGSTSDLIEVRLHGYAYQTGNNDPCIRYYVSEGTYSSETVSNGVNGDGSAQDGGESALMAANFVLTPGAAGTRTITLYVSRPNTSGGTTYLYNARMTAEVKGR